ncbi:unnamed protein product [Ranitomeya imitator]|uniref:N-CoR GPS2-interacting domain-containing protein n=1 Tax=Ranitomeya imitator TaxID=111125 RepID=A0ABN9MJT5_9NEOB|nr:unnamed protein product [Ranitomeya imitator]
MENGALRIFTQRILEIRRFTSVFVRIPPADLHLRIPIVEQERVFLPCLQLFELILNQVRDDRCITGKLEPVSPSSPPHVDGELDLLPTRLSKEELIQNMDRVDREITMVEQQISKLKKKQLLNRFYARVASIYIGIWSPSCAAER